MRSISDNLVLEALQFLTRKELSLCVELVSHRWHRLASTSPHLRPRHVVYRFTLENNVPLCRPSAAPQELPRSMGQRRKFESPSRNGSTPVRLSSSAKGSRSSPPDGGRSSPLVASAFLTELVSLDSGNKLENSKIGFLFFETTPSPPNSVIYDLCFSPCIHLHTAVVIHVWKLGTWRRWHISVRPIILILEEEELRDGLNFSVFLARAQFS
jgi:hypothetical protein